MAEAVGLVVHKRGADGRWLLDAPHAGGEYLLDQCVTARGTETGGVRPVTGQGSCLVAGLLAASAVVGVVHGLATTEFLAAAAFPGPISGAVGLPMLGLGAAKGVEPAWALGR